ncbi:hypothetical protein AVEN_223238-1 [Araneus ventricosus]|uniref:Uncharacterized protein n=1 Tax=Araneus ventricosus TaxID=182803 RepID=A0A4Y2F3R6_ARAVE|nr:hypothetical protein AVEN_13662-1 [Araneus ventricosus]GBN84014.1 hypothetical protein AVEN_223238-1 [Araneus ventricosus]
MKADSTLNLVPIWIAILACSNLALQIRKLAASLTRQECKHETSYYKQASYHALNLEQACCVKLIAICSKNRVQKQPQIRTSDISLPKPVVVTTRPASLREKIECANRSFIYNLF